MVVISSSCDPAKFAIPYVDLLLFVLNCERF